MAKFWSGFVVASVIWGVLVSSYLLPQLRQLKQSLKTQQAAPQALAEALTPVLQEQRQDVRAVPVDARPAADGHGLFGDALGAAPAQRVDAQKVPSLRLQLEQSHSALRRCVRQASHAMPPESPMTLRWRVQPNGAVSQAQVRGSTAITASAAAPCLLRELRTLDFAPIEGRLDRLMTYTITMSALNLDLP
ncbi:MAG: hypothetical protein ACPGUV_06290 [Polyangiales bacterium]